MINEHWAILEDLGKYHLKYGSIFRSKSVKKCFALFIMIFYLILFLGCTIRHQVYPSTLPNIPPEQPERRLGFALQKFDKVVKNSVTIKITGLNYKGGPEGLYYIGVVVSPENQSYIKSVSCSNDDFGIIRATFSSSDLDNNWGNNIYIRYEPWGLPPKGPIMTSKNPYKMEETIITLNGTDDFNIVQKNIGLNK